MKTIIIAVTMKMSVAAIESFAIAARTSPALRQTVSAPARSSRNRIEAMAMVGLVDRADHLPDQLSGGERQRVTIARALVNDPAIVWADEPTGDLDSEGADETVALMRRLNEERKLTFVVVTHDIAVGRRMDRIVRMLDGRIVEERAVDQEDEFARAI